MTYEEEGWHTCHFCGEYVNKEGFDPRRERHYLSDCRPDLVEHEIGETCTWSIYAPAFAESHGLKPKPQEDTCYAYQDRDQKWTKEHIHFYPDGPM